MKLRFTLEAGQELIEARAWYEERREGLGAEFQRRFEATAEAIRESPLLHAVVYGTRRRAFLRPFPYYLLYDIVDDTVVVLGCVHFARNPSIWRKRSDRS